MTLFAMGITPYINASIIMQMMTIAIPQLEAMSKEGESGRKRIAKITRYLTIVLGVFQAAGFSMTFRDAGTGWFGTFQMMLIMTAGTCFLLWLGEQVTEKGIGNGVSLVIFAGIMTSMPYQLNMIRQSASEGLITLWQVLFFVALFVATVLGIVYVTQGTRRIPIQHAKRVIGMKQMGGQSSFLPIKVVTAGVIPIIFAISILLFPAQILATLGQKNQGFWGFLQNVANYMTPSYDNVIGLALYAILIVLFTYFYTSVIMNVNDMADNLKKHGNYIPGIRPGKPTFEYLDRVISRITLAGAIALAAIALIQYIGPALTGVTSFTLIGGTSLLIVVGVAIETMQAIEAQLLMRNYEGFIKPS
jgi:preprotein translocase subunit SecY